jgi:hypothetical protein
MLRKAHAACADEQRASPRYLTFRTGKIVSLHDDKEILAAVLDLSDGGACLLVSNIMDIPDRFQFFVDCACETYCCEVRWRSGHKVGIRFL